MASIVSQRSVADGYNVTIETAGRRHTVHFGDEPTTTARDAAIDVLERQITDTIAADVVVESEELLDPVEDSENGLPN